MSGINILRKLLLIDAVKKSGQASGIMSIGDSVRKLADKRLQAYLLSAQKKGVDLDKLSEQEIKYMLEMNKPKAPRVISQGDPEFKGITEALLGKRGQVIEAKFGKPFKEEIGSVDNIVNNITRMEPIAAMKEVNKVLRREGKYKNLSKQDSEKVFNDTDDWINQRDPTDLYDYRNKRPFREDPNFDPDDPDFDPENFADGGVAGLLGERQNFSMGRRIGLKEGNGEDDSLTGITMTIEERMKRIRKLMEELEKVKKGVGIDPDPEDEQGGGGGRTGFKDGMTRRSFLKILGGLASIPIIGKVLKPLKVGKTVTKVPIIKTDNVAGKPEWFDQLVNKVIIEGDDVTKKFATGERQSIHQKTLDDGSVVRVTEDIDDGAIRVEYDSDANVFEETVQLQYKKPLPDEGAPRPTAEFTTAESGPVGRGGRDPDGGDYEIEVDEVGGTSIKDLDSDVSKLKEYATGKKLTMKEIVESKKRRDKAKAITDDPEAQSDAVIRRQGEADDSYYGDPDEFASGGIARMLGE